MSVVFAAVAAAQTVADADLPRSEYAVPWEDEDDVIQVELARDGALRLDGAALEFAEFEVRLAALARAKAAPRANGRGVARQESERFVRLRADGRVPAIAVTVVIDSCMRQDVGLWKISLSMAGDAALPLYQPLAHSPHAPRIVRVELAQPTQTIAALELALVGLANDPAQRVASAEHEGQTETPAVLVSPSGEVPYGVAVEALECAIRAGLNDVRYAASWTEAQRASWAEQRDLRALIAATSAGNAPPSFFLQPPDDSGAEEGDAFEGWNLAIGLGGSAGGAQFGGRSGGRRMLGRSAPDLARSIESALEWLRSNQAEDGRWSVGATDVARVGGHDLGDLGVTALALLAFLGDGNTLRSGPSKETVRSATLWIRSQQDPATGRFGVARNELEHALATCAVVEAFGLSQYALLGRNAKLAVAHLATLEAFADPVAEGWRVQGLCSARDFAIEFDAAVLGRTSEAAGGAKVALAADGAALFTDILRGETVPPTDARVARVLAGLPARDATAKALDPMAWYYGSFALYQVSGAAWRSWSKRLNQVLPASQVTKGKHAGAWQLAGPGSAATSRVFATATLCLALESYYRYGRIVRR